MKLSVLILTYNEEKNIAACIQSAAFADEVVVIDSGSTDRTREIAEGLGARFVVHPMDEDGFAGQRNYALMQTDAEWVFYLDADERIPLEAAKEIRDIVQQNEPAAYQIKRMNIIFGQLMKYGGHRPDYSLRLYPRKDICWYGNVHEHVETKLSIRVMHSVMNHHTYDDWDRYFEKFNRYTTMMAEKMQEKGKKVSFIDILLHPMFAFLRFYILRLGFLDGKQGFIFAVNHYFYTMIKYVKLYYQQKKVH